MIRTAAPEGAQATKPLCTSSAQPAPLRLDLPPSRQIFLGQWRRGGLGLHHDPCNSPAAGFSDRLNAVYAARDQMAVDAQRVQTPQVRNGAEAINAKIQLPLF